MFTVTQLFTYPIKSMGGIQLEQATITSTGFEWDRHWMLVNRDGRFLSQRDLPLMALCRLSMTDSHLVVHLKGNELRIPKPFDAGEELTCTVWDDEVKVKKEDQSLSDWFSAQLDCEVTLVRATPDTERIASKTTNSSIAFPDGGQYLICGEAALNDLNARMEQPIGMDRFRPNIVFSGGEPFAEDNWAQVEIGGTLFQTSKPCDRCSMTTINQQTAEKELEPLRTLATFRRQGNKVIFGNYMHTNNWGEKISRNDRLIVTN